jgi:hypothetical protein
MLSYGKKLNVLLQHIGENMTDAENRGKDF